MLVNNPYRNQSSVPKAKREYIESEMPVVFFVWIVFIACGKKEIVVQNAAPNPIKVIRVIAILWIQSNSIYVRL